MRIALYTMHSPAIGQMADITIPNKSKYCCRNGYSLHQFSFTGERHKWPGYDRIPILIELLKSGMFDWIFWLGCDAMITNMGIKLESIVDSQYGMIIACDATQIQMDSFIVQSRSGGLELLEAIWNTRDVEYGPWYEQSNLDSKRMESEFLDTVKIIPQRTMNSMIYELYPDLYSEFPRFASKTDCNGNVGQWERGDFVFHVPGRPLDVKLHMLREISKSIVE